RRKAALDLQVTHEALYGGVHGTRAPLARTLRLCGGLCHSSSRKRPRPGAARDSPDLFHFRTMQKPGETDVHNRGKGKDSRKESKPRQKTRLLFEMRDAQQAPGKHSHSRGGEGDFEKRLDDREGSEMAEALAEHDEQHEKIKIGGERGGQRRTAVLKSA